MESDGSFNEEFKSTIKTEISKNIEGYELADSWEMIPPTVYSIVF